MKLYDAGAFIMLIIIMAGALIISSQEGCAFRAKELDIYPSENLLVEEKFNEKK